MAIGFAAIALGVAANVASNHPAVARKSSIALIRASLDATEREQAVVAAFRRRWWNYFVPSHGVLAVTPRRLLFGSVEPKPGLLVQDAPASVAIESYRYDSIANFRASRTFAGTERAIAFDTHGETVSISVEHGVAARIVDSVIALVATHTTAAHEARRCEARLASALAAAPPMRPETHTIARGDALFTLARQYQTTVEELRRLNALTSDEVRIGQAIVVREVVDSAALRARLPVCPAVPELSSQ
ncbi:MAG: LysM peptidoglycan-binding domain-containing protein [Gemmatimonadota bacterium]|nr:LysM peptidoglycan-binding domain-containing protein [Gemmatimonadota bacterium]